jgi:hypothetical protein
VHLCVCEFAVPSSRALLRSHCQRANEIHTHTHTKSECKYRFSTGGKQCGRTTQQQQQQQQRHSHTHCSLSLQFARELSRKREKSPSLAESPILGRASPKDSLCVSPKQLAPRLTTGKPAHSCKMRNALAFLSPSFHFSLS